MKRIVKSAEPDRFANWKAGDKMAQRGQPRWNRVPQPLRTVIHESLMHEQGGICCYCEGRIRLIDSHIEHFRPQEHFESYQLDYGNLLCSCVREQTAGEPRHCGHRKGSWFEDDLLVSPLTDCEDRFRFTGDGQVHPADGDAAATTTIDRLALNLPKLQALRAAAVEALADIPPAGIRALLAVRTHEGSFLEYFTTVRELLA